MNNKLVSCIIPTRNRQHRLRKAIESVGGQSYKDLEIIVVDDASEDGTEGLVRAFIHADNRIHYIRNPAPLGESGARNVGIQSAKGDYMAFLDDDDLWRKNKVAEQLRAIRHFDAVLCAYFRTKEQKVIRHHDRMITPYHLKRRVDFGLNSCLLARSSLLKQYPYDENLPYGPDVDLLIRLSRRHQIGYVAKVLVILDTGFHGRISNLSLHMPIAQMEDRLKVLYKHKEFFGPFWFKYHEADFLLAYIRKRDHRLRRMAYTIKRCGIVFVLIILFNKLRTDFRKIPLYLSDLIRKGYIDV
ncbi:MAG: glycosyltransferase family 2 protein [Pseudomonadota bacterium]